MYFLFTQQTIAVSFIKRIDKPTKNMNETKRAFDACVCVFVRDSLPVCVCVLFLFPLRRVQLGLPDLCDNSNKFTLVHACNIG